MSFLSDKKGARKTEWGDPIRVGRMFALLSYLKNNPHPTIVSILDCKRIDSREYSYDMPLLAFLSDSQHKLVNLLSLGSEVDRKQNMAEIRLLEKKHPKLAQVVKKINSWKVYGDLHGGNVMRNRYGNYKLIDLEGFGLSYRSHHEVIKAITSRR
jgi:hypothetical protein